MYIKQSKWMMLSPGIVFADTIQKVKVKTFVLLGHSIELRNVIKLLQKNWVVFIQKQIIPSFYTLDRFVIWLVQYYQSIFYNYKWIINL